MGTRGSIEVQMDEGGGKKSVWLYQHWDGDELAAIVARALKRGESRGASAGYLTRIIFCQMLLECGANGGNLKKNVMDLTGFAIGGQFNEANVPVIVVDTIKGRVGFRDENNKGPVKDWKSFPDFIKSHPAEPPRPISGWKKFFAGL